jgi:hypothetical protein
MSRRWHIGVRRREVLEEEAVRRWDSRAGMGTSGGEWSGAGESSW